MAKTTLFWFRRDLRWDDNVGLFHALKEAGPVQPVFIFDSEILSKLDDASDARVTFIHETLQGLKKFFCEQGSDLVVRSGSVLDVLKSLAAELEVGSIYTNHDYEPAARARDEKVAQWAQRAGIEFRTFKDQTLFEKDEILSGTGKPYTVYTPYKKKVLATLAEAPLKSFAVKPHLTALLRVKTPETMLTLQDLGFQKSSLNFPSSELSKELLLNYAEKRDFPAYVRGTSLLGLHLRFGTVSVRALAQKAQELSPVWLSELIWRDFFMQILWHFPQVEKRSFRPAYEEIAWRKDPTDFQKWCLGQTGYPLVDAGMRELNATGFMHNRVRMVVASFLCKHLLIHWYEGERYFAKKLLDYDLSANNGNWQWAAGSGCDAAPYFRIFNPMTQHKKFDPQDEYVKKWVPEWGTAKYPQPMIAHEEARGRCLSEYNKALKSIEGKNL